MSMIICDRDATRVGVAARRAHRHAEEHVARMAHEQEDLDRDARGLERVARRAQKLRAELAAR